MSEPQLVADDRASEDDAALPEKFKDVSSLVQSYSELEREFGARSQKLREAENRIGELEDVVGELQSSDMPNPPAAASREQQLARLQQLAERASMAGAEAVLRAVSTGVVEAPEDPQTMKALLPQIMPIHDREWHKTDPNLLGQVLLDKPYLLPEDMRDMQQITNGLSAAAAIARGMKDSATVNAYERAAESEQMKMRAQTLSGAAGRPETPDDDQQFFDRIKHAAGGSWSNRRR